MILQQTRRFLFQIMDMYKNEEMEYELGPKTEFYV